VAAIWGKNSSQYEQAAVNEKMSAKKE